MFETPTKPTLLLIDGMSLVFQAFYAIRGLRNDEGMPTGAVLGFTRHLLKLIGKVQPSHLVVVFDSPGDTFRHEIYNEYKANRDPAPEDFHIQLPYIFKILDAMGVPQVSKVRYEADDILGTLAKRATAENMHTVIVTADKDLFQLVDDHVTVLRSQKGEMVFFARSEVKKKMGVEPSQIVDYLALVGDSSDNIPGVPRVGPKTATALLAQFPSLDSIYENLDQVANVKRRALLADNVESARLSHRLADLDCQVQIDLPFESVLCEPLKDAPELLKLYKELGFTALLREQRPARPKNTQTDMFDSPSDETAPEVVAPSTVCQILFDPEDLRALVGSLRQAGRFAIDTETTSIDSMSARLVGISLSHVPGHAQYIPVGHEFGNDTERQIPLEKIQKILGPILADPSIGKIAQNAKYDMRILSRHGLPLEGLEFDTMLASYILDPESKHGLKAMARRHLGVLMTDIDELIGKGRNSITMDQVEIARAAPYAAADADMTLQLANLHREKLQSEGLLDLLTNIEMPLVTVLDAMETEGISLDKSILKELSEELRQKTTALAAEIHRNAGQEFSINSPKQVAEILFDKIGLKPRGKTKTGNSTRSEVLRELAKDHPLPGLILEYRHLDKLQSTYVEALPKMVNPRTGRIHTSYNQFVAATGRLSSSAPNLQNIPKRGPFAKTIRKAFKPNHEDHVFLAADYSQIELRVLAHICADPALRQSFRDGTDIHTQTAARVFDMMPEMVTDDMRSQAKVINFGILYGMSAHRLSGELSISRTQAQKFIDEYFAAYPRVSQWTEALLEDARESGYVTTLSGRRRAVPKLNDPNRNIRANAERMAINTPIQGSSADMIKIAMIRLHEEINNSSFSAKMVLQVHDELIFTLPNEEIQEFEPLVREIMETALPLEVPIKVDTKTGRNWGEC